MLAVGDFLQRGIESTSSITSNREQIVNIPIHQWLLVYDRIGVHVETSFRSSVR
jgi:hypothetical protein